MKDLIEKGDVAAVAARLEAEPGLASRRTDEGVSLLLVALYHGRTEIADLLRARLAAPDAFEAAALGEAATLVALLRDEPALVDARSADGFTALHLAAFFGRDRAARVLLGHGADLEAVHPANGLRPLNSGAASRRASMVRLLLAAGADPDARQKGGFTALHSAARHGDLAMTEALLVHGADVSLAADDGKDALAFAREGGAEAVVRRLEATPGR